MNWLDWVLILIIIFSTIKGLSTGFFAGASSIAGLVLGIVAAIIGYRPLAIYLDRHWGWGNSISEWILNYLPSSSLQNLLDSILIINLPQNNLNNSNLLISDSLNNVADQLAITILGLLSFILILFFVSLVVKIVMGFFPGAMAHTFLGPLDYLGGLLLGLVRGMIIVLIIAFFLEPMVITSVIVDQEQTGYISQAANNSTIIPLAVQVLDMFNLHLP